MYYVKLIINTLPFVQDYKNLSLLILQCQERQLLRIMYDYCF